MHVKHNVLRKLLKLKRIYLESDLQFLNCFSYSVSSVKVFSKDVLDNVHMKHPKQSIMH